MKRVRELEGVLLRIEGGAVVVLVLVMLVMAGYNVVFRNVLMPLQSYWAHSGPPIVAEDVPASDDEPAPTKRDDAKAPKKVDEADSFRGGFGQQPAGETGEAEEEEEEEEDEEEKADDDEEADGFRGGFGKTAEELEEELDDEPEADGFRGGFGKTAPDPEAADDEEDIEDDLDEQFANLPDIDTSRKVEDTGPQGGPPEPGSFAAWGVAFIDELRMDWVDALLRQLVIMASFLGAALATARGKHINVDALSKILPPALQRWAGVATNLLAIAVCLVLASAGNKLVALSREYNTEVTPFADEWHFQLMFPIGFGLLALHFTIRALEGVVGLPPPGSEPPPPPKVEPEPAKRDEEDDE